MLEDITGSEIKEQFKTNKKLRMTTFLVGGVAILALGYFAYLQFFYAPENEKSKDAWWPAMNTIQNGDSTQVALDEFKGLTKKYDGKVGGEVSQFIYATQLMEAKEFKKAIEELEGVNTEDTYVAAMSVGLQGDCYSELDDYAKAGELYFQAADINENDFTTPMYLKKAGLCAEQLNDFKNAKDAYQRIKDNYNSFSTTEKIEKDLERVKTKL